jgi:diguanylate cyclase (GGDEF)-like protein
MNEHAIRNVLACPRLPTLPSVAVELLELTQKPNVQLQEIALAIQNDQALTAKVLRTVNSSFYGLTTPCATIPQAVAYLGINAVKSLVLSFSLVQSVGGHDGSDDGFDFMEYWRRAVYSAAAARTIADAVRACNPEEAFVAALIQDIGMVIMYRAIPREYLPLLSGHSADHSTLLQAERSALGFDHGHIGGELAQAWKLPAPIVDSIRFHHESDAAPVASQLMARIVALAGDVAATLSEKQPQQFLMRFIDHAQQWFKINEEHARSLLGGIAQSAAALSSMFKLQTGQRADVESILALAEQRLVQHHLDMNRRADQLEQSNLKLERQNLTDALTGVANRKHFDQQIPLLFNASFSRAVPLSLVFCDLDRFKAINDSHGHQAGDAVLVEVARIIDRTVGSRGTLCRYGGEEFVVYAEGIDRVGAARLAEQIRQAVERAMIPLPAGCEAPSIRITVSVGVAAIDAGSASVLSTPEALVRAADQAVYAAKAGGRNCARVFSPKPRAAKAA